MGITGASLYNAFGNKRSLYSQAKRQTTGKVPADLIDALEHLYRAARLFVLRAGQPLAPSPPRFSIGPAKSLDGRLFRRISDTTPRACVTDAVFHGTLSISQRHRCEPSSSWDQSLGCCGEVLGAPAGLVHQSAFHPVCTALRRRWRQKPRPDICCKCMETDRSAEMPRGYYANARELSRLSPHRDLYCCLEMLTSSRGPRSSREIQRRVPLSDRHTRWGAPVSWRAF
jgi:hypothetical protein